MFLRLQGLLAVIHDNETNNFVYKIAGKSAAGFWIGARRVGPEVEPKPRNDQFSWNDGSELEYDNWQSGDPNNKDGEEFCVREVFKNNFLGLHN